MQPIQSDQILKYPNREAMMAKTLKIDFVSDISCPWCVNGLGGLEKALHDIGPDVEAHITFRPFELNPTMGPEGQNIVEHIGQKYGSTPEQSSANRAMIKARAGAFGFTMATSNDSRIYNTFDAHRLLHWAESSGHQAELKKRLFEVYFTEGRNPSDTEVLVSAASDVGLDANEARAVLTSGEFADEVRESERLWQSRGITAVPSVIINEQFLIQGGQPPEAFEKALRTIAAEA